MFSLGFETGRGTAHEVDRGWLSRASHTGACLVLFGSLFAHSVAAAAPRHFVVLVDASGSMDKHFRGSLWGERPDLLDHERRLGTVIQKVLNTPPGEGIPAPAAEDLLSIVLFRLDWRQPSYNEMFLSWPETLLIKHGAIDFQSDVATMVQALREIQQKKDRKAVFSGNSPLVAATDLALPYLGSMLDVDVHRHVSEVYLVRITDGRYLSRTNAADEASSIRSIQAENGYAQPLGFGDYRRTSSRVRRALDLRLAGECALVATVPRPLTLTNKMHCGEDAYKRLAPRNVNGEQWSSGLFASWLRVEPRNPAASLLVFSENSRVSLDLRTDGNHVEWYASNALRVSNWTDDRELTLSFDSAELHLPDGSVKPCELSVDTSNRSAAVGCPSTGDITIPADQMASDDLASGATASYEFDQHIRFVGAPNPLYPFSIQLPRISKRVELELLRAANGQPLTHYPAVDSPGKGGELPTQVKGWLLPSEPSFLTTPITPAVLTDAFRSLPDSDLPEVNQLTGLRLATLSRARRDALVAQYNVRRATSRLWLGGILLGLVLAYLVFPLWRRYSAAADMSQDVLTLDFNAPQSPFPSVIGQFHIRRVAPLPLLGVFNRSPYALKGDVADVGAGKALKWRGPTPGIMLDHPDAVDMSRKVFAEEPIPILFKTDQLQDIDAEPSAAEPELIDVQYTISVPKAAGESSLPQKLSLSVAPETSKPTFSWTQHTMGQSSGFCCTAYKFGQQETLIQGMLSNDVSHRFSLPAEKKIRLRVRRDGARVETGFYLRLAAQPDEALAAAPATQLALAANYQRPVMFDILVNYAELEDPVLADRYELAVLSEGDDGALMEQQLLIKRSVERTNALVEVVDSANVTVVTLSPGVTEGDGQQPASGAQLNVGAAGVSNLVRLCTVRLTNTCAGGRGYIDYSIRINGRSDHRAELADGAIRLQHQDREFSPQGRLNDNDDALDVYVELLGSNVTNFESEFDVSLDIELDVTLVPEGELGAEQTGPELELITMRAQVLVPVKHVPQLNVLAVDFGTSAIAMAHATGSGTFYLLDLDDQLSTYDKSIQGRTRLGQSAQEPFLASNSMINFSERPPARREDAAWPPDPRDPDFLELPAWSDEVYQDPGALILSLKLLIAAGRSTLELPSNQAHQASAPAPTVEDVLVGAYRRLREDYIDPILGREAREYPRLVVTYPNTYTNNHLALLKDVVESAFTGAGAGAGRLWTDYIEYLSESDAICYYYLTQADKRWGGWENVPESEVLLVIDIGAGTLDMSLLEITRSEARADMAPVPKHIRVLNRTGVNRAGNLLTECIARDLDAWLQIHVADYYERPIVTGDAQEPGVGQNAIMLELREEIEALKRSLSAGEPPRIRLSGGNYGGHQGLLQGSGRAYRKYKDIEFLEVDGDTVVWAPSVDLVTGGEYVSEFARQVGQVDVQRFIDGYVDKDGKSIDTAIVTGRTALWPGLVDQLKASLPQVSAWTSLESEAFELKKAAVDGALTSVMRWPSLTIEDPKLFGFYCLLYEVRPGPNGWCDPIKLQNGVRCEVNNIANATAFRVGLQTTNGFLEAFSFDRTQVGGNPDWVAVTLHYEPDGTISAIVESSSQQQFDPTTEHKVRVLSDKALHIWPMGSAVLKKIRPNDLMSS